MTTVVLGGTFDPIHNGHVFAAKLVSGLLGNVPVQMVVAGNPRLRNSPEASQRDRWKMTQLSCADDPLLVPNDIELQGDKPTLTADTLALLHGSREEPVVWLIGSDAVAGIHRWHRSEEISQKASLVVLLRGLHTNPIGVEGFEPLEDISSVVERSGSFFVVEHDMLDISATLVRSRIKEGSAISSLVHPSVREYIIEHKLYRT